MTTIVDQFAPSTEIDALCTAARWPNVPPRLFLVLLNRFLAGRRFVQAYEFFEGLSAERTGEAVPLAAAGFAQSYLDGRTADALAKLDAAVRIEPGLSNFLRGVALAQAPAAGRSSDGIADLELVVALADRFPAGLRRAAYQGLATLYSTVDRHADAERALARAGVAAAAPSLITDSWVTDRDGFRFVPPRLVELADGVHVAQGYDFGDIAFVRTGGGVVAIDTGSTPANASAALAAYRSVTTDPITHIVLTHGHWDHIGGLAALRGPDTLVVARDGIGQHNSDLPVPWPRFLPAGAARFDQPVVPDLPIAAPTALRVGDVELALIPVRGGETNDALLIHLPARGVLFAGDILMPHLGAPFLAEGSPEGLLDGMRLVEQLAPSVLIHGHPPLTDNFPVRIFPGLRAALESLYQTVNADLRAGRTLSELLRRNHLPNVLRDHSDAILPYLILRDNMVKRMHRQRTGYWQPDGEGIEDIAPADWSLALDLLADGDPDRHADVVRDLADRDHLPLALRLADLALRRHPDDPRLAALRQETLVRLVARHHTTNPFGFIVYSGLSGLELPAPDL